MTFKPPERTHTIYTKSKTHGSPERQRKTQNESKDDENYYQDDFEGTQESTLQHPSDSPDPMSPESNNGNRSQESSPSSTKRKQSTRKSWNTLSNTTSTRSSRMHKTLQRSHSTGRAVSVKYGRTERIMGLPYLMSFYSKQPQDPIQKATDKWKRRYYSNDMTINDFRALKNEHNQDHAVLGVRSSTQNPSQTQDSGEVHSRYSEIEPENDE